MSNTLLDLCIYFLSKLDPPLHPNIKKSFCGWPCVCVCTFVHVTIGIITRVGLFYLPDTPLLGLDCRCW